MAAKTLVLYKSATGFTERYVSWIKEELNCDMVPYTRRGSVRLSDYDRLIYGGGFYAGRISGLKWFLKATAGLKNVQRIVLATGATPPEAPDVQTALRQNFADDEWKHVSVFYVQSGLCYERMNPLHKLMMAAFCKMMAKQEGDTEMTRMIRQSFDATSKEQLRPLLDLCRK